MMWLTHTAVGKPLAIIAIFMAVVAAGIASFFALPINLFPKFDVPCRGRDHGLGRRQSPTRSNCRSRGLSRTPWRVCRTSTTSPARPARASPRW